MSDAMGRRRSVDVGGLALALSDENRGHGWGGWEETDCGETRYAEVLIDVRVHTETMVSQECDHIHSFINLNFDTRQRLVESLSSWHFEPLKLPDEEVIACAYILFEALYRIEHMQDIVAVPLGCVATFLQHLCQLYRQANTYHNFQHALDVFQAVYHFLFTSGMVPPVTLLLEDGRTWTRDRESCDPLISCLTDEDLFALCIAAVGHDVGHPGLTNAFMKNAKTPLAVVYDDKSVLEQMHYSLILQIMRHNNLGFLLDRPASGPLFRKLLLGTVLATDMGVHFDFMTEFRRLLDGADFPELKQRILVCQALIKCADISNPSRPYLVSQHWATALESEWSSQLLLEKHLQLPPSVRPSDSRVGEANGQIWFNNTFARPLFELVAEGIPSLEQFACQTRENLALWHLRAAELAAEQEQPSEGSEPKAPLNWPSQAPNDFLNAFPPALPESFRAPEDLPYPVCYHHHRRLSTIAPSTSSSSSTPSHYESCESSLPSPSFSPVIEPAAAPPPASPSSSGSLPPRLELTTVQSRAPSVASTAPSTSASVFSITNEATAAIRAAYKASVRKKKSFHRSSWNPSPTAVTALSQSAPVVPTLATNGRSPVSPAGSGSGDSPMSLSAGSQSTGMLTPSPLTPEGNATTTTEARTPLLKAALVPASS
ncbi:HD-domain/PDEase-like protein [Cubamyces menziesii]|nr:HD-domain/PDEase-like protein [Cubamyces menziesii]